MVETTVVGLFGLVAVATDHAHWLKDREEVIPITGPLNAWIDSLPSKTLKRIEKNLAPCLFAIGCAVVAGPDIAMEIKIRARDKDTRQTVSGPPHGAGLRGGSYVTAPGGIPAPTNGAGQPAGGAGGWHSSVPTAPPGLGGLDVGE